MTRTTDVLVVGGGPTGLAAANALGIEGVDTLLVEEEPGVAELPRAVSVDDEAMRFMQRIGLGDEAREVVLPAPTAIWVLAELAHAVGPPTPRGSSTAASPRAI